MNFILSLVQDAVDSLIQEDITDLEEILSIIEKAKAKVMQTKIRLGSSFCEQSESHLNEIIKQKLRATLTLKNFRISHYLTKRAFSHYSIWQKRPRSESSSKRTIFV